MICIIVSSYSHDFQNFHKSNNHHSLTLILTDTHFLSNSHSNFHSVSMSHPNSFSFSESHFHPHFYCTLTLALWILLPFLLLLWLSLCLTLTLALNPTMTLNPTLSQLWLSLWETNQLQHDINKSRMICFIVSSYCHDYQNFHKSNKHHSLTLILTDTHFLSNSHSNFHSVSMSHPNSFSFSESHSDSHSLSLFLWLSLCLTLI